MSGTNPRSHETEDERRAREATEGLPAGLDESGRDEGLEHAAEVQPSGAGADRRHSAPGTSIPGAPRPAAEGEDPSDAED